MILSQVDRAASAPCPDLEGILEASRAQYRGSKMAQKGDFVGAGIFATASPVCKKEMVSPFNQPEFSEINH